MIQRKSTPLKLFYLLISPIIIVAFLTYVESILTQAQPATNLTKKWPLIKSMPYLFAVAVLILIEKVRDQNSWKETFSEFGIKKSEGPQLKYAAIGIGILTIGYSISLLFLGEPPLLKPAWPRIALQLFLEAGIAEEILFRGFLYRKLRNSQPFLRATFLSGIIFGIAHLANLSGGFSLEIIFSVFISISYGLLLSFTFAALFEIGGHSLIGGILFHFVIDTINLFQNVSQIQMMTCLGTVALAGLTVFLISYRKLSPTKQRGS